MDDRSNAPVVCAAEAIWDKKGFEVRAYDVRGVLDYTDALVICSAGSDRHSIAIADNVAEQLRRRLGLRTIGEEGLQHGRWVLLDFGEVVVHIFHRPVREYYDLDRLFRDCPVIALDEPDWARDMMPDDIATADDFGGDTHPWHDAWRADGGDDLGEREADSDDGAIEDGATSDAAAAEADALNDGPAQLGAVDGDLSDGRGHSGR